MIKEPDARRSMISIAGRQHTTGDSHRRPELGISVLVIQFSIYPAGGRLLSNVTHSLADSNKCLRLLRLLSNKGQTCLYMLWGRMRHHADAVCTRLWKNMGQSWWWRLHH